MIDTLSTTVSPWVFVLVVAVFAALIAWIIRAQNKARDAGDARR
jgi:hypothetical protein